MSTLSSKSGGLSAAAESYELLSTAPAENRSSHETTVPSIALQDDDLALRQGLVATEEHGSSRSRQRHRSAGIVRATISFLTRHSPFKEKGRRRIWKRILSSGPAYEQFPPKRAWNLAKPPQRYEGWQMGTILSAIAVGLCFILEVAFLAFAITSSKPQDGLGLLYTGDCNRVKNLTILLLLPLNVIATVLIGTSNYVMQCLSAPSREEVDRAHAEDGYLNIGLSSFWNMKYGSRRKVTLWWLLAASTVPIHLLLNSAVFGSLETNNYGVMVVSDNFEQDVSWNYFCSNVENTQSLSANFSCTMRKTVSDWRSGTANIIRLNTAQECMSLYATNLQSKHSNVVLVATDATGDYVNLWDPSELWDDLLTPVWDQQPFNRTFNETEIALYSGGQFDFIGPGPVNLDLSFDSQTGNVDLTKGDGTSIAGCSQSCSATSGIFLPPEDPLWDVSSLRAAFNVFDYRFWSITQQLRYNLDDTRWRLALQWSGMSWMCPVDHILSTGSCNRNDVLANSTHWRITPSAYLIDHCYSMPTKEQCSLHYSLTIIIIVIVCDIIKIVIMVLTLRIPGAPLVTMGDAIRSFMTEPEPLTMGRCLMREKEVPHLQKRLHDLTSEYQPELSDLCCVPYHFPRKWTVDEFQVKRLKMLDPRAIIWRGERGRWFGMPSKERWIAFFALYIALFVMTVAVFLLGIRHLTARGLTSIWDHGFSGPDPDAVFSAFQGDGPATTIFSDVVTLNSPQVFFSIWYFIYNGMFTSMVASQEWGKFAKTRKGLRVSKPKLAQRSTYWLQLPWSYSIPLIVASGVLHWLIGRSLFLVKIDVFGWNGVHETWRDISACGFSPLAMLLAMLVLILMGLALLAVGLRKLEPGIPTVGTSSMAISAACHGCEKDTAYQPLMWGVTREPTATEPGHCCFTTEIVEGPVEGQLYE